MRKKNFIEMSLHLQFVWKTDELAKSRNIEQENMVF